MLFTSFPFVIFLIVLITLYYTVRKANIQIWLLIIASIFFYGFYKYHIVYLLLLSAMVNVFASYAIAHWRRGQKAIAISAVFFNIGLLSIFKYGAQIGLLFFKPPAILFMLVVPAGMSFYTFEGISLVIDVFKGRKRNDISLVPGSFVKHIRNSFFFISFFPHLVAGPILKAHSFLPQIGVKKITDVPWQKCFKLLIIGYFLKMVIADNMRDVTMWIQYPNFQWRSSINLLIMPFGFLVQIFSDFAGYSLIAVGLARIFGYRLLHNFNFPFISTSFREFWKRWNISLSAFLTEYLYIPLGGNRKGAVRTCINILITMIIGGIWHGGTFGFFLWGFCHGLALVIERIFKTDDFAIKSRFHSFVSGCMVFTFVAYAALLFSLEPKQLLWYFLAIKTNLRFTNIGESIYILTYSLPVAIYHLIYWLRDTVYYQYIQRYEAIPYAVMLFLILTNIGPPTSFMYFQF